MSNNIVNELDQIDTGDILLFVGNTWYDKLIQLLGRSPYCHVAMVLKSPTFINEGLTGMYIIESGIEKFPDAEDNKYKFGVQVNDLQKVLNSTDNKNVFVRKLTCKRDQKFYEKIKEIHDKTKDIPYDISIKDWLEAKLLVDTNDLNKTESYFSSNNVFKTNTFWCSALLAYIYEQLGLLKLRNINMFDENIIPWTIIAPKEFSVNGNVILDFINCKLSDEIQIR